MTKLQYNNLKFFLEDPRFYKNFISDRFNESQKLNESYVYNFITNKTDLYQRNILQTFNLRKIDIFKQTNFLIFSSLIVDLNEFGFDCIFPKITFNIVTNPMHSIDDIILYEQEVYTIKDVLDIKNGFGFIYTLNNYNEYAMINEFYIKSATDKDITHFKLKKIFTK
jgi:hypothetical protein